MATRPDIFLDTSALFAGIWSPTGGARLLLKLGEAKSLTLIVSSQVLTEIELTLRSKASHLLPDLTVLLDRVGVMVADPAPEERFQACLVLTCHTGDARVIADSWASGVDFFVTLDRQHFLDNRALQEALPFPMGTPGDCLAWLRSRLVSP